MTEYELNHKIDKIVNLDRALRYHNRIINHRRNIIGSALLVLFLMMMTAGILIGDLENNILPKAIRFCLECIGIG